MKVHKLEFVIANPEDEENYPQFIPTIDGHKEAASLLIFPLELSEKKDGMYPILNCGCGEWGCGGYYVDVKNTEEYIIWDGLYGLVNQKRKIEVLHAVTPIYFLRKEYNALVKNLLVQKDRYKYEANVYNIDKEQYETGGLKSLVYMEELDLE